MNNIQLKQNFLEIIHQLLKKPSQALTENQDFIKFLRTKMIPSLVNSCINQPQHVMTTSLGIFFNLVKYFRKHFLEEI